MTETFIKNQHPEALPGEIFLTNTPASALSDMAWILISPREWARDPYDRIGWKTKRKGQVAYDIYGKRLTGYAPVFVKRKEILNSEHFCAISADGKLVHKDDAHIKGRMRENIDRNIRESRAARAARKECAPRC